MLSILFLSNFENRIYAEESIIEESDPVLTTHEEEESDFSLSWDVIDAPEVQISPSEEESDDNLNNLPETPETLNVNTWMVDSGIMETLENTDTIDTPLLDTLDDTNDSPFLTGTNTDQDSATSWEVLSIQEENKSEPLSEVPITTPTTQPTKMLIFTETQTISHHDDELFPLVDRAHLETTEKAFEERFQSHQETWSRDNLWNIPDNPEFSLSKNGSNDSTPDTNEVILPKKTLLKGANATDDPYNINHDKDIVISFNVHTDEWWYLYLNKYFANQYLIDRWDGTQELFTWSNAGRNVKYHWYKKGSHEITLSLINGDKTWAFSQWVPYWWLVNPSPSNADTLIRDIGISKLPAISSTNYRSDGDSKGNWFHHFNSNGWITYLPEGSFDLSGFTTLWRQSFWGFNENGALESLPEGSFNTKNIKSMGTYSFWEFNKWGKLKSLPEGSFRFDNLTNVADAFFYYFNFNWALTSLPSNSFNIDNISSAWWWFFFGFNANGRLKTLPEGSFHLWTWLKSAWKSFFCDFNTTWNLESLPTKSFNLENITSASNWFFGEFNMNGKLRTLPENSFHFSTWLNKVWSSFFNQFNQNGALESLPEGSFNTENITSEAGWFFSAFNSSWRKLSSLPNWSFQISPNLTKTSTAFFQWFNQSWNILNLPKDSFNTKNITSVSEYFFDYFNEGWKLKHLPDWSFSLSPALINSNSHFFEWFNKNWALTSLPEGSFNTENITTIGDDFFNSFNAWWALSQLPENSFNIDHLSSVGNNFFKGFNQSGALTALPSSSFNTENISSAWNEFFSEFNHEGKISQFPENFTLSPVWVQSQNGYQNAFNSSTVFNKHVDTLIHNLEIPSTDRDTFSNNQPWISCDTPENWLVKRPSYCPNKEISIILSASATETGQTLKINPYLANTLLVDRWDGSTWYAWRHNYAHSWDYHITLNTTAERWSFKNTTEGLVPKDWTTMTGIKVITMPSLASWFWVSSEEAGDSFFQAFNSNGAISALPEWSFDTSYLSWSLGKHFLSSFNKNGALTSLPEGSFSIDEISEVGDDFFSEFNYSGNISSLPQSFTMLSLGTSSKNWYQNAFNSPTILTTSIQWLIDNISIPFSDRNTFSSNQPGISCSIHKNWLVDAVNGCQSVNITHVEQNVLANNQISFSLSVTGADDLEYSFDGMNTWQDENTMTLNQENHYLFAARSKSTHDLIDFSELDLVIPTPSSQTHKTSGSSGWLRKDHCPKGDFSDSYYDRTCVANTSDAKKEKKSEQTHGSAEESLEYRETVFQWAKDQWLTAMDTLKTFRAHDKVTRAEMAKIISIYATKFLWQEPDITRLWCTKYPDITDIDSDLHDYIIQACRLKSMGVTNTLVPMENFDPQWFITKAQVATLVSRVIRGQRYLAWEHQLRYENHFNHMLSLNLMTVWDVQEDYTRGEVYALLMNISNLTSEE